MPFVTALAGWLTLGLWVARTGIEKRIATSNNCENFKYFEAEILPMKDDKFWAKVREAQKDPKFRKAIKEFVKLTTSRKSRN